MASASKLVFDGREYKITKGEIVAALGDPYWCDTYNGGKGKSLGWSIEFETDSNDLDFPSPSVSFDGIQVDIKNWHELVGYQNQWTDAINSETDDRYGLIYVYNHQLISDGRIQIVARDRAKFRIVASGQNEEGQRFTVDGIADFKGIYVHGSEKDSEATIRARLRQYLNDENLTGSPFELDHKYDSGVKMGRAFYSPK